MLSAPGRPPSLYLASRNCGNVSYISYHHCLFCPKQREMQAVAFATRVVSYDAISCSLARSRLRASRNAVEQGGNTHPHNRPNDCKGCCQSPEPQPSDPRLGDNHLLVNRHSEDHDLQ